VSAESDERQQLALVQGRLRGALRALDTRLDRYSRQIQDEKAYLWESRADMDHVEKVFTRQTIEQSVMSGDAALAHRRRLAHLLSTPYFGRIDFERAGRGTEPIYIGVHHFTDEQDGRSLIHDWRAPVSSLFYDHELGPARYDSPAGPVEGRVVLKRQFRIRNGELEFLLESDVSILDDLLQQELSRTSDDGMRQIVATIQRDQNAIIRDGQSPVLVIQGVAGSGKTSIALHRIAFLLYRFKGSLTSRDILIISPNRVFADYISNVLPELGEDTVPEVSMEALAAELLGPKIRFQTFMDQTTQLLSSDDADLRRRISFKATPEFLTRLEAYVDHVERATFAAQDVWMGRRLVPAWYIDERFRRHRGTAPAARLSAVAKDIEHGLGIHYNHDPDAGERAELRAAVRRMYRSATLRQVYKEFFTWAGEPDLFTTAAGGVLEYADVFPLIFLHLRLENVDAARRDIKHLVIDEMQDYTAVQYAVIARLFACNKTILGDTQQTVNPYGSSTAADIQGVFPTATCVTLNKSYRSTWEIARFAQRILPNPDLVAVERHGAPPDLVACSDSAGQTRTVSRFVMEFAQSAHRSLAVICKTERQARRMHEALLADGHEMQLLTPGSQSFARGAVICTAYLAKGLEFDRVIVPFANEEVYHTPMDRHLLYVACTRAMHSLAVTFIGRMTPLITS
jgi:DNA helicase-2/ATP-dependent DNA helicase PcrA